MGNRLNRIGLATALIVGGAATLSAQQSTGALKGRVTASSGAAKAGVTVTIQNKTTGLTRTMVTGQNGGFAFVALPVGTYEITYAADGNSYKQARTASLGHETDASFKWPSASEATVEVVGTAPTAAIIDNSSSQVGVTVSTEMINSLPLVSRDINQAAVIAPSVSIVQGSQIDPTKKTSTYIQTGDGGGRGTSFSVDGGDNNSTDVGGYVLPVPVDAISEFQVVTNQYKAEFGKSTSGFFNVVTKSGGNEFAGMASAQYQNQNFRARSTDEGTKKDNSLGIYSMNVNGPIVKDRLFYSVTAERQQGSSAAYSFTPFSISLQPGLAGIRQGLEKKNVYTKIDWVISDTATFAATYGYYQDQTPNQPFPRTDTYLGNILPDTLGTGKNKTWAAQGKLTWTLTPSVVWESTYRYFDYKNGITPHGRGLAGGAPMAVVDYSTPTTGAVDPLQQGWGGLDPNTIQNTGIKRGQFKNELTWIHGAHTLKAGADLQRTTYADQQLFFNETGPYRTRVTGGATGFDYVSGWGPSVVANQNVLGFSLVPDGFQSGTSFKQYGIYLQDDWAINDQWSVYGGLRVDWDTQLDYLKNYANIYAQIRTATNANFGPDGAAGIGSAPPEGKKYWQPRIQALYKPNDKLTFKFGAGRFVAQVIDNVTGFTRSLGNVSNGLPGTTVWNNAALTYAGLPNKSAAQGGVANFSSGSTIGFVNGHAIVLPADFTPYNYANNVNGLHDYFRNTVNGWLSTATADSDGKSLLASDFQYPTTDAYNLGFSYSFNEHHAIDVTAIYSKTHHLTVNVGYDGSGPAVTEFGPAGGQLSDSVFYSNQTASSRQLQTKYTYSSSRTSFVATLTVMNEKASEGGSGGAFDQAGTAGLYGEGAIYGWVTNPERRAQGSATLLGSFAYSHSFDFGTQVSFLGTWHSGRAYDIYVGYNQAAGPGNGDLYHPSDLLGYRTGRSVMDVSFRVAQVIKFGPKFSVEPYIAIQNLLNNYDYGSNYGQNEFDANTGAPLESFGQRLPTFQVNNPRNGVVGVRVKF